MLVEEDKIAVEVPELVAEVPEVVEVTENPPPIRTAEDFHAAMDAARATFVENTEPFVTFASLQQAAVEAVRLAKIPPEGFTTKLSKLLQQNWDKDSYTSTVTMPELPMGFRLDWLRDDVVAKTLTEAGWEWRYDEKLRMLIFGAVGTVKLTRKPRTQAEKVRIEKPVWPKPQRATKPILKKGKK